MSKELNYAVQQRLRMIDMLLEHYGTVRRSVLSDYFGISTPQASKDLGDYNEMAPGNMEYDLRAKCYKRTEQFKRIFP